VKAHPLHTPFCRNVAEGTQLRFVKVFPSGTPGEKMKKWMNGKSFPGNGLWAGADKSAANVVK
jgi:hypothetical protein